VSDLSGQLDIRLHPKASPPAAVIRSSRPLTATRVFAGKPLATVSGQLPLLFSVCGTAQAMACALACEAALGWSPAPSAAHARRLLLHAETVKEHLWRLMLDWPRALERLDGLGTDGDVGTGHAEREVAMAAVMRAFLQLRGALTARGDPFLAGAPRGDAPADVLERAAAGLAGIAAEQVFGMPAADWLAEIATAADLAGWASQTDTAAADLVRTLLEARLGELGRCESPTLPAGDGRGALSADLLSALAAALGSADADAFVAAPLLDGHPAETTPYARELARGGLVADIAAAQGNGLLARLAALLAELARDAVALAGAVAQAGSGALAGADSALAAGTPAAVGIGAAPAARGLLVHRVELLRGDTPASTRVLGYRILAPTEWNFHPAGVVATALADIAGTDGLSDAECEARARLVITAVDPCVDYRLSVS